MKMHILSGGRLRLRKSIYMPDAERAELIDLPVNCYLLRHPEGNVLFDTGCHPSTTKDAAGRWGSIAKAIVPILMTRSMMMTCLIFMQGLTSMYMVRTCGSFRRLMLRLRWSS